MAWQEFRFGPGAIECGVSGEGRGWSLADHQEGAGSVVVISDRYWRSRLNADPKVLGKEVRIGALAFSIVGVMPASFRFPDRNVDLWLPRIYGPFISSRRAIWYTGIGRLKPGVTLEQARADLDVVAHYVLKGLRVIAPACAAGLALAAASGRFIWGMLCGVSAYDPATRAAVVVIVVAVATLASLRPAARAARVEPVRVLREE